MKNTTLILVFVLFMLESCVPPRNTPTPTITVLDYVSTPEYNRGCKEFNLPSSHIQAGFLGIYSGKTTEDVAKNLLGEPSKVFNNGDEVSWYYDSYDDTYFSVIITGQVVRKIDVDNMSKDNPTLLSIIEKNGCPSIIQALDTSEGANGTYDRVLFSYPEIGVEFWFEFDNIMLESIPSEIKFFKPKALGEYIDYWGDILFIGSPLLKPVDWSEVVVQ